MQKLPRIGKPAERALSLAGVESLADLTAWTERDLSALHGVGPKAVRILSEALAARGLQFKAPE